MNPRILSVKPLKNHLLYLKFNNGECRYFDVSPYMTKGIFRELVSPAMFNSVYAKDGSVQWVNEADLCPDTLYLESIPEKDFNVI